MPNEESIDEYINRVAFKADTDYAVEQIERLKKSYSDLSNTRVSIGGSLSFGDVSKGVQQAEKQTQALLKTQQEVIKVKRLEIALENDLLKLAAKKQKAAEDLAKAQAKNVQPEFVNNTGSRDEDLANIKKTGEAVTELDKAQAQATNSAFAMGQAQQTNANATRESGKAAKESALTEKQLALAKAEGKLLAQQQAAALKNQVREEIAVKGSLEQRRAALIRLNAVYDNQSPAERASAAGLRLQKIIQGLTAQVQSLEVATGRAQRNVGNYPSALNNIASGASKAFAVLRNLAYLIPGLGLAGLIGAIIDPVVNLTKKLLGFGEVNEKLKKQQELVSESFKTAADAVGDEIAKVTLLKTVLESDNATRLQKIEALKQLKAANVDYFGQLDLEDGKVTGLTLSYDGYISRLIRSINAKANVEQLTQALKEQANAVGNINKGLSKGQEQFTANNLTQFQIMDAIRRFNLSFGAEEGQSVFLDLDQLKLIADLLNAEAKVKDITKRIKADVSDIFNPKADKTNQPGVDQLQALKELLDNSFKLYEIAQKAKLRQFERDLASDKVHYLDKISIVKDYYDVSLELINEQEKEELRLAQEKARRDKQKLEEDKAGKSGPEVARINENIKRVEKNLQQDLLLINANAADKRVQLAQTTSDKKVKIDEDYLKQKKDFLDQEAEYEKFTNDEIERIRKRVADNQKEFENKELELFKELQNKKVQAAEAAAKALFSIGDGYYQRQLNQIALQRDEIDKQKDAELAANDARVQSEQDKAANIAIINSRAAQQKEALDRKTREIELQRAKFDRAQQAFEIGIQTIKSIAEIKAKAATLAASGNPLVAALAAKALAQIPLVLATSAASIAALFATPLPRLFRGKKKGVDVGGMALINDNPDGTTTEVIERADGSIEMPTGRNVVMPIGKNDIVHPDANAWANAVINAAHRDTARGLPSTPKDNAIAAEIRRQTGYLKQIAGKPVATTHATDRGLVQVMHWGARKISYVNENTNW